MSCSIILVFTFPLWPSSVLMETLPVPICSSSQLKSNDSQPGKGGEFWDWSLYTLLTVLWDPKCWGRMITWSVYFICVSPFSFYPLYALCPFPWFCSFALHSENCSLHHWHPLFHRPGLCSQDCQFSVQLMERNKYILSYLWLFHGVVSTPQWGLSFIFRKVLV